MDEMVLVGCVCCNRPMSVRKDVIEKMVQPMTFCESCDQLHTPIVKRLCMKVDLLTRQVSYLSQFAVPRP